MRLREFVNWLKKENPTAPATPKNTGQTASGKVTKAPIPAEPAPFEPAQHVQTLTNLARQRGLKSQSDLSNFLAQCKIETGNWTRATESFNYTDPQRIYKVFTSNFKSPKEAEPYVGNPVALANRALANKNGNGDEKSGDGWKFRGRGFIHLTGRALYAEAGAGVHPNTPNIYISNPALLSSNPKEAALTAIWYYKTKVGKGKTANQATKVVNPAGLKKAERAKAAQQIKTQMAKSQPKPAVKQSATPKPKPTQITQK
jgi:predicted chitinase